MRVGSKYFGCIKTFWFGGKKTFIDSTYNPSNLVLDRYDCTEWFKEKCEK